jgi:hypothetical protein
LPCHSSWFDLLREGGSQDGLHDLHLFAHRQVPGEPILIKEFTEIRICQNLRHHELAAAAIGKHRLRLVAQDEERLHGKDFSWAARTLAALPRLEMTTLAWTRKGLMSFLI